MAAQTVQGLIRLICVAVRVTGESGKVDLLLTKENPGQQWTALGQPLAGHSSLKVHKDRGRCSNLLVSSTFSLFHSRVLQWTCLSKGPFYKDLGFFVIRDSANIKSSSNINNSNNSITLTIVIAVKTATKVTTKATTLTAAAATTATTTEQQEQQQQEQQEQQ